MVKYDKIYLICISFFVLTTCCILCAEKLTYISTERPYIDINKKYVTYGNLTALRRARRNPLYYVDLNLDTVIPLNNKVQVDFYFYQFLTNRYHPTFVEMHFKFCDLIEKDMFFGAALRQGMKNVPCPFPAGPHNWSNMTVLPEAIPKGFPFVKGRIYCNLTYIPKNESMAWGHIDMELKQMKIKNRKPGSRL